MKKIVILLISLTVFILHAEEQVQVDTQKKKLCSAGLYNADVFPFVTVKNGDDMSTINSAVIYAPGAFINYDGFGLSMSLFYLYLKDLKEAKSSYGDITLTLTDNSYYNNLSTTILTGTYSGSATDTDKNVYYPDMVAIKVSDTFLYFFNKELSLKNIYLGTDKPLKSGGSFYIGNCIDYIHIKNTSNILIPELNSKFSGSNFNLTRVDYYAISPVVGGMYNFTLIDQFSLTFGLGLGPSYVARSFVRTNHGGETQVFTPIGKALLHLTLNYTNDFIFAAVGIDMATNPSVEINNKYQAAMQDLDYKTKIGVRF
jgi:hypothetical protein